GEVPLQPAAKGEVRAVLVGNAGHRGLLHGVVATEAHVRGEAVLNGHDAEGGEVGNHRLDIGAGPRAACAHFAEVANTELGAEIAIDPIAAECAECRVLVIAAPAAARQHADAAAFRLDTAHRGTDVGAG